MRFYPTGGGGGPDLDVITAGPEQVLSPYVTVDKEGEPVTGTMPDNGSVSKALNCGESYTVPEGFHDGTGSVTANSLASQTGGATAVESDVASGKTYWKDGAIHTGSMASMAGGTYTPTTSQTTISCSGKHMTSNIIIPAFSLPSASIIKKGSTVTIYGKSVTGAYVPTVKGGTATCNSSTSTYNNTNGTTEQAYTVTISNVGIEPRAVAVYNDTVVTLWAANFTQGSSDPQPGKYYVKMFAVEGSWAGQMFLYSTNTSLLNFSSTSIKIPISSSGTTYYMVCGV